MEFKGIVKEILCREVVIKAESVEEARLKLEKMYRTEEIVLDADDLLETSFDIAFATNDYEIMYIITPSDVEKTEEVILKFNKLLVNNGASIEKTDRWGNKRLAYEIQDLNEGFYVLVAFTATKACVRTLDKEMKTDDNILRHMIIRKGE